MSKKIITVLLLCFVVGHVAGTPVHWSQRECDAHVAALSETDVARQFVGRYKQNHNIDKDISDGELLNGDKKHIPVGGGYRL